GSIVEHLVEDEIEIKAGESYSTDNFSVDKESVFIVIRNYSGFDNLKLQTEYRTTVGVEGWYTYREYLEPTNGNDSSYLYFSSSAKTNDLRVTIENNRDEDVVIKRFSLFSTNGDRGVQSRTDEIVVYDGLAIND